MKQLSEDYRLSVAGVVGGDESWGWDMLNV